MERKPAALFAPVSINAPPSNSFENIVLPLSRARAGAMRSLKAGLAIIIGSRRVLDNFFAVSTVGIT